MALTQQQRVALRTWTPSRLRQLLAAYQRGHPGYQPPGGVHPNIGGFTPYKQPDSPPPGTYDPGLDAQLRAAQRGYGDTQQDYTTGKTRAENDYLTNTGDVGRQRDQTLSDLTTGHDRTLSDLLQSRTRAGEDYRTQVAGLQRSYSRLGERQVESVAQAGGGESGALAQAFAKRTQNEAIDQAPVDTNYNRFLADSQTAEGRLNQDFGTQTGRVGDSASRDIGRLSLALDRAYGVGGDQTIGLARAGRELGQLGIDTSEAKWAQAGQTGYVAPGRPAGEHVDPRTGQVFRLIRQGGRLMRLQPSGQVVRRPSYSLRRR